MKGIKSVQARHMVLHAYVIRVLNRNGDTIGHITSDQTRGWRWAKEATKHDTDLRATMIAYKISGPAKAAAMAMATIAQIGDGVHRVTSEFQQSVRIERGTTFHFLAGMMKTQKPAKQVSIPRGALQPACEADAPRGFSIEKAPPPCTCDPFAPKHSAGYRKMGWIVCADCHGRIG